MAEFLLSSDYRELPPEEYCKLFKTFIERHEFDQIMKVVHSQQNKEQHEPFHVSMLDIVHHDPALGYHLLYHPLPLLDIFENALLQLIEEYRQLPEIIKRRNGQTTSFLSLSGRGGSKQYHVRVHTLPPTTEITKSSLGQLRVSADSQHFLQVTGTVVRTGSIRMLKVSKEYQCMNPKCGYRFHVRADPEQGNLLPQPTVCPAPTSDNKGTPPGPSPGNSQGGRGSGRKGGGKGKGGGSDKGCTSYSLREIESSGEVVDYQEIKLQDQMERLQMGQTPRSLVVVLEADLVDQCNPGDDVIITGTMQKRWKPVFPGQRCQLQIALRANSLHILHANVKNTALSSGRYNLFKKYWMKFRADDLHIPVIASECKIDDEHDTIDQGGTNKPHPHEGRNKIVATVCPQLHGMFFVKLCLLLTLIGGSSGDTTPQLPANSSRNDSSENVKNSDFDTSTEKGDNMSKAPLGSRPNRRFQSHLLIVGDPGTGKSQLLKFASKLLPRSVMTTGVGTSGAGLTCSALRDGPDWILEAGALVLANGGVCCIDEFASIKEQDRATIHEAMEQQTISVAKAGLVTKLNSRCSVIAVCNPKGQYDVHLDICTNTNIASPLLSRFDLVLILLDTPQKDWDKKISTFLLNSKVQKGKGRRESSRAIDTQEKSTGILNESDLEWNLSTLRSYVMLVRDRLHPQLSEEARCLLMRYYQLQRQQDGSTLSIVGNIGAGNAGRITVRALESSLRLAEAHAKLMFHKTVTFEDAVVAIRCMELSSSLTSTGVDKGLALHSDFPNCAAAHYREIEEYVLGFLQYSRAMVARDIASQKKSPVKDKTSQQPTSTSILSTHDEISASDEPSNLPLGCVRRDGKLVPGSVPKQSSAHILGSKRPFLSQYENKATPIAKLKKTSDKGKSGVEEQPYIQHSVPDSIKRSFAHEAVVDSKAEDLLNECEYISSQQNTRNTTLDSEKFPKNYLSSQAKTPHVKQRQAKNQRFTKPPDINEVLISETSKELPPSSSSSIWDVASQDKTTFTSDPLSEELPLNETAESILTKAVGNNSLKNQKSSIWAQVENTGGRESDNKGLDDLLLDDDSDLFNI